jgi:hypothetical protein
MNHLERICEWAIRTFVTVVALMALVAALRSDNTVSRNNKINKASSGSLTANSTGQQILDIVPDGGSMTYDQFTKQAGPDVAKLLAWASPKTVTRKGKHLIIDSAAAASTTAGGVTIGIGSRVEFDVDSAATGLAAKNITGVKVVKGSIGPLPIRKATMTNDGSGNINIRGSVELTSWLPYWNFDVTVGPDGKPVP